jgi:hypothetical protein
LRRFRHNFYLAQVFVDKGFTEAQHTAIGNLFALIAGMARLLHIKTHYEKSFDGRNDLQ